MALCDWSSDVCSSDLHAPAPAALTTCTLVRLGGLSTCHLQQLHHLGTQGQHHIAQATASSCSTPVTLGSTMPYSNQLASEAPYPAWPSHACQCHVPASEHPCSSHAANPGHYRFLHHTPSIGYKSPHGIKKKGFLFFGDHKRRRECIREKKKGEWKERKERKERKKGRKKERKMACTTRVHIFCM